MKIKLALIAAFAALIATTAVQAEPQAESGNLVHRSDVGHRHHGPGPRVITVAGSYRHGHHRSFTAFAPYRFDPAYPGHRIYRGYGVRHSGWATTYRHADIASHHRHHGYRYGYAPQSYDAEGTPPSAPRPFRQGDDDMALIVPGNVYSSPPFGCGCHGGRGLFSGF